MTDSEIDVLQIVEISVSAKKTFEYQSVEHTAEQTCLQAPVGGHYSQQGQAILYYTVTTSSNWSFSLVLLSPLSFSWFNIQGGIEGLLILVVNGDRHGCVSRPTLSTPASFSADKQTLFVGTLVVHVILLVTSMSVYFSLCIMESEM